MSSGDQLSVGVAVAQQVQGREAGAGRGAAARGSEQRRAGFVGRTWSPPVAGDSSTHSVFPRLSLLSETDVGQRDSARCREVGRAVQRGAGGGMRGSEWRREGQASNTKPMVNRGEKEARNDGSRSGEGARGESG